VLCRFSNRVAVGFVLIALQSVGFLVLLGFLIFYAGERAVSPSRLFFWLAS
jgi:hypothetical protein